MSHSYMQTAELLLLYTPVDTKHLIKQNILLYTKKKPGWNHNSTHAPGRLLGGGLSVLALDSYELHVISEHYSGWRQLCVRAQPCMHGSGDAAYFLCMLCCLYIHAPACL
jgi:hypothetical protein